MFAWIAAHTLHFAMIGGVAAVSVPIIIHLISKHRHRRIRWGAMQFLLASVQRSSRRIKLQQLILLIIRCLILALVAIALMRPFFNVLARGRPDVRTDMVILLDNSMSMGYGAEKLSVASRAARLADRLMGLLKSGDTITIIAVEKKPRRITDSPLFDVDKARKLLKDVRPSAGPARFFDSLLEALRILETTHNPRREVFIVTDMQAHEWTLNEDALWQTIQDRLKDATPRPSLFLLNVQEGTRANRAITQLSLPPLVLTPGRTAQFTARVANLSPDPVQAFKVEILLDGKLLEERLLDLKASESAEVSFSHRFTKPGWYVVSTKIPSDSLPTDNVRNLTVQVKSSVPVLMIEEKEKEYLTLALAPTDEGDVSSVKLTHIQPSNLPTEALKDYSAVILTDTRSLSLTLIAAIESYVQSGGGLLIVPGDGLDIPFWNENLYAGGHGFLPAPFKERFTATDPTSLSPVVTPHPALAFFSEKAEFLEQNQTHIVRWMKLAPTEAERVKVLAGFKTGDPFILERPFGKGTVILLTTDAHREWNDLPTHGFFVAMLNQLVFYVASRGETGANPSVGDSLTFPVPEGLESSTITFTSPDGERHDIEIERAGKRFVTKPLDCPRSGVYFLNFASATKNVTIPISVGVDPRESDLSPLTPEQLTMLRNRIGLQVARNWDDLENFWGKNQIPYEMWRWFILAALALMLLENYLTRRWSRPQEEAKKPSSLELAKAGVADKG